MKTNHFLLAVLFSVWGLGAVAQSSAPLSEDDPAVWAARRQRAESLRTQASAERQQSDAEFDREEAGCRSHFLENACKSSARERWIVKINKVRALEIEAVGLERAIRTHDLAEKEKERRAAAAKVPELIVNVPEAPAAASAPASASAPQAAPVSPAVNKPSPKKAKSQAKIEAEDAAKAKGRAQKAAAAAERARRAKEDAARYEARAKALAERNAKKGAGQSAPAAK